MTIYNINLGIGWASSGVEYAQAYRAQIFRRLGLSAKFVFTNMFQSENLQHFTQNIGFRDDEIIWLYGFFTDIPVAPTTYRKEDLEGTFSSAISRKETSPDGKLVRYYFEDKDLYVNASLCGEDLAYVQRAEYVSGGSLIRKDYFSYTKLFSEYYTPSDGQSKVRSRSFFNEDGSLAYEENCFGDDSIFTFPDRICYSQEDLLAFFLEKLELTKQDILLLDRATGIAQAVFEEKGQAKLAVVVHAEHYNEKNTSDQHVLWNNYYEYQFSHADKVDAFITSTAKQAQVLSDQFSQYTTFSPAIYAIPVGSLEDLRRPLASRKPFSLITGSRLAKEKHIDWLVQAVALAHEQLPELQFDIFGEGGERQHLQGLIDTLEAGDYIHLRGHQNLTSIYQEYEVYLTASTSEGFGLTLMEAVGSGLPLIGLDVPYGNQTFIDHGHNGYLIEASVLKNTSETVQAFAEKIVTYFTQMSSEAAQAASYELAREYQQDRLEAKWKAFVEDLLND